MNARAELYYDRFAKGFWFGLSPRFWSRAERRRYGRNIRAFIRLAIVSKQIQ